jgi:type II secretory pathway pseudopilin PulG
MRHEHGETTLTGMLVAMVLFGSVLAATLSLFGDSERINRDARTRIEAQDQVSRAEDALTRELRNLASPTPSQPLAVDRAGARDLVFKTVDAVGPNAGSNTANVKRTRYCLDGSGRLWKMTQLWTDATVPAVPGGGTGFVDDASCATTGWNSATILATNIVNYTPGRARPLFTYNVSTDLTAITRVAVDAFVDVDVTRRPAETELASAVFLRNQNRSPTAALLSHGSPQGLLLNGSLSSDPEGEILTYCWYDASAAQIDQAAMTQRKLPCTAGPLVGTGVTYLYVVPYGATRTIWLEVRDPADLLGVTARQSILNTT